ncbi:MAG: Protein-arginine kinase activator protein [Phycisphaerae bacterium]|nr:Protein-arginine kinase activator protein [Phycisphaerae bacterium]
MIPCERCKKAQATFHLTNIKPSTGEKVETHLCESCAVEEGFIPKAATAQVEELLANLMASKAAGAKLSDLVCDECGMSFLEFRQNGLLGCPQDYDVFRESLEPMIERAQDGATQHTGKAPRRRGGAATPAADRRKLKKLLAEAVAAEDYERAAELRDRIREVEGE